MIASAEVKQLACWPRTCPQNICPDVHENALTSPHMMPGAHKHGPFFLNVFLYLVFESQILHPT